MPSTYSKFLQESIYGKDNKVKLFIWYKDQKNYMFLPYKKESGGSVNIWYGIAGDLQNRQWGVNDLTSEEFSGLGFKPMKTSPNRNLCLRLIKDLFILGDGLN